MSRCLKKLRFVTQCLTTHNLYKTTLGAKFCKGCALQELVSNHNFVVVAALVGLCFYKIATITHATFAFRYTASFVWERLIVFATYLGKKKDPTGQFVCLTGHIHAFIGVMVVI